MEKGRGDGLKTVLFIALGVWLAHIAGGVAAALLPFAASYIAARMAAPSADAVSKAFRVDRKVGGAVYAALLCFLLLWFLALLSGKLAAELGDLLAELPEVAARLTEAVRAFGERLPLERWFADREGEAVSLLSGMISQAAGTAAQMAAAGLAGMVQGFPGGVLSLAVTGIGFIYLTADPEGAAESVRRILPRTWSESAAERFRQGSDALFSCLRGALFILCVTFAELTAGLTLLGTENALAMAALIAVVDILPVLGCGTVLVPWALVSFLGGRAGRGIGLLLLLGVIWLVRQFLEPRVIGKAAGVHPFLALAGTYVGFRTAGIGGMLAAPVLLSALSGGRRKPERRRERNRGPSGAAEAGGSGRNTAGLPGARESAGTAVNHGFPGRGREREKGRP